ncbi:antiviral reverse transcriptase Drt3a [Sphingobium lignivorans]|uniref:Reverse transcriptase domain-containing protein n=1 Tax=Sphingobium lignivorans TaxID=2735886 RepID=A0ABR6NBW0_9SPHN|nr:antiviral reverse transcriptase Drt3a [Sphingobium lignivorans]MBB5984776.1 hypothetical protein [Sphingobium lignivorans]
MGTARFTSRSLRAEIRSTDGPDYGIEFDQPLDDYISEAEQIIAEPHSFLSNFNRFQVGPRQAVSYSNYSTVLALRILGTYLKRRYALQSDTRHTITRGIIQALSDSSEMNILRRDISSFYEHVPTEAVRDELLYRDVLPPRARRMLEAFFTAHCQDSVGLPRGLGLSAILSEYVLRPVDQSIRLIPGVYRYHRFVDDIILFTSGDAQNISSELEKLLPSPLKLNRSKSIDISLERPSGDIDRREYFEYLGYRYTINLQHSREKPRKISVTIAKSKIDRIKTRLLLSAMAFSRGGRFDHFHARIRYLAGNYKFQKRRPLAGSGRSMVRSGIFYNYRYCGEYQGAARSTHPMSELRQLDWFLQNTVLGSRAEIGRKVLAKLNTRQLAALRKMSFAQGHSKIFATGFKSTDVKLIKQIWKNV